MKINEITITPSREEPIENYQYLFDNAKRKTAFNNLEFSEVLIGEGEHYLGLFNDNKLISILWVSFREENKWQINYAQTDKKFRGHGCFRYLLHMAVYIHNEILSDDHQTVEAKNAWNALIRYTDKRILIFAFNTITKKEYPKNEIPFDKIWDEKENFLLLVKKSEFNKEVLEHMELRDKITKKVNRDYLGLWYGPNSSNDEYENP